MVLPRRITTAVLCVLLAVALVPQAGAHPRRAHASNETGAVIVAWNQIAQTTVLPAVSIPIGQVHLGFVSMAMYDAVDESLRRHGKPASASAAAATAAHDVLAHYFASARPTLAGQLAGTLAGLSSGQARDRGVAIGHDVAADLIDARVGDGLGASITFDRAPAIGVWRPTAPLPGGAFLTPWLGFMDPLVLRSTHQVDPGSPDPLTSRAYALDLAEVQLVGASNSATRTSAQTFTAHFFNFSVPVQMNAAMRGMAAGMDVGEAARFFGLANTSAADAIIACWREKFDEPLWRPITAIHQAADDGNPRTSADPSWAPLAPTPPYPDWTSGHACLMGAYTTSLRTVTGGDSVSAVLPSVVNTAPVTRTYTSLDAIRDDAFNARIWLGYHFRAAMVGGYAIGDETAKRLESRFGPLP